MSSSTREHWRSEDLAESSRERAWTPNARCGAVLTTATLDGTGKGAWCREHGVYLQGLPAWRRDATDALAAPENTAHGLCSVITVR